MLPTWGHLKHIKQIPMDIKGETDNNTEKNKYYITYMWNKKH